MDKKIPPSLTGFLKGFAFRLFHHNLLRPHILSFDESKHIHASGLVDGLAYAAVDLLTDEDTAVHVNHLQGGMTLIADDPVAVAEEGEGV